MISMPERVLRPSEDTPRVSEDTINKPLLRNSYQSAATARTTAPTEHTIHEQPADESPSRPNSGSRQHHHQQAHNQLTSWQPPVVHTEPPHDHVRLSAENRPQDFVRLSTEQRPIGPGAYGRSTSNDYTVYGGVETPTPVTANQIPGNESSYFRQPYRRAGPAPSVRDTVETGSLKTNRYTPLHSGHKVTKSNGGPSHPHWPDGYDGSNEYEAESTPPRPRGPKKQRTSLYIVRQGEGGDDGSPPPEDILRLPFANFMAGTVRNRESRLLLSVQ